MTEASRSRHLILGPFALSAFVFRHSRSRHLHFSAPLFFGTVALGPFVHTRFARSLARSLCAASLALYARSLAPYTANARVMGMVGFTSCWPLSH